MSLTSTAPTAAPRSARRVRHQARDAVVLMAFSAATSTAVAALLLAVTHLAPTGR